MNHGLHPNLPNATYHADPALGASGISRLRRSPAHFRYAEAPQSKALEDGKALHMAILEPKAFAATYAVAPVCDRRTTAGKAIWSEFIQEHQGVEIITASDYDMYRAVSEAAHADPVIRYLLSSGEAEVSVFAEHPEYGIPLKCRPDWYPGHVAAIPDIKTTEDARPWAFASSVHRYGYHRAAAHYMDTIRWAGLDPVESFFLIAVEKTKPYGIMVYELDDAAIEKGRAENDEAYRIYAECLSTDTWPSYAQGVQTLSLPGYAK